MIQFCCIGRNPRKGIERYRLGAVRNAVATCLVAFNEIPERELREGKVNKDVSGFGLDAYVTLDEIP